MSQRTDCKDCKSKKNSLRLSRREFALGTAATAALTTFYIKPAAADISIDLGSQDLSYMPASVLIELFKARKLSPVDVLKAQIERFEKFNAKINCVTYTHFDTAMKQAKESEDRYFRGEIRPLEGVTCGVKDEHHDAGWIVTQGSVLNKDDRKDKPDFVVKKLKQAGAVLPIQTTVPEFYLHGVTFTKLWGCLALSLES